MGSVGSAREATILSTQRCVCLVVLNLRQSFLYSWSFGILLWELYKLCAREWPFPDVSNERISEHIVGGGRSTRPEHASDEMYVSEVVTANV